MFSLWRRSNDITQYCAMAACDKALVQKDTKRADTSGNSTQISKAMRYSQYVRTTRK